MSEQTRSRPPGELMPLFPAGPDGPDGWGPPEEGPGLAVVGSGIYSERLPVGGMTVEAVRSRFADRLDQPLAQPEDRTVDHVGQVLEHGAGRQHDIGVGGVSGQLTVDGDQEIEPAPRPPPGGVRSSERMA